MKEKSRYRPPASYIAKTPEARERQLAGLKRGRTKGVKLETVRSPGGDPFHPSFIDDITAWAEQHFYLKESRKPISILDWERDILNAVFHTEPLPTMALLGMCKKSGKSTLAALAAVYRMCTTPGAEIYVLGPDLQQGQLVIFEKIKSAIELHPMLSNECKVSADRIDCKRNGSFIMVLPCNSTAAGLSPDMVLVDELWQFTSQNAVKAWDEMTNIPHGLKHNLIFITTYAGFSSDDDSILWKLYRVEPRDERFFFLWKTDYSGVPWVNQAYLDSQRKRLRANTYARFHENQWASQAEQFVSAEQWDGCVDKGYTAPLESKNVKIVVGIDASVSGDSTGIVAVRREGERVLLVRHKIIIPSKENPIDFQNDIENYVLKLDRDFSLMFVFYDPYQLVSTAQRLTAKGVTMRPFNQTTGNLTEMAGNVYDLIRYKNLVVYADADDLRSHALNATALETDRGYRISKSKSANKIDCFIALAMACQGATQSWRALERKPEPDDFYYDFSLSAGLYKVKRHQSNTLNFKVERFF